MSHMGNAALRRILVVLACVAIIAGCASFGRPRKPVAVPEIRPGVLAGYQSPVYS